MKKLFVITAILASTALFTGCASSPLDYKTGTQITQTQLDQFKPGDTQQQIVSSIGQPNRKEAVGAKELWYYDYQKVGAFGGNVSEATVFEFDSKAKLVQAYKTGKAGKTGNALLDAANK
jgi:outer membrane protein assembly factor BamE (lipoprotein component of BamABCDE complex)